MTSDVLGGIFDLPTYPNQILYYINYVVKSDAAGLPTDISTKYLKI